MYENGIAVVYETFSEHQHTWGPHAVVTLPGWCAGDPQMAVALYLHGHRDHVVGVRVVDWSPIEDVPWAQDDDDPACGKPSADSDLPCGWPAGHTHAHQDGTEAGAR